MLQDGATLCALVAHLAPDQLDFSTILRDNRAQNMRTAYTILTNQIGTPSLLDFSDLIDQKTSERALIFFVGQAILSAQQLKNANAAGGSQASDLEVTHLKSKVQILERKLENLTSTAQRLAAGFSMVMSSSESMEESAHHTARTKGSEMEETILRLEKKINQFKASEPNRKPSTKPAFNKGPRPSGHPNKNDGRGKR